MEEVQGLRAGEKAINSGKIVKSERMERGEIDYHNVIHPPVAIEEQCITIGNGTES